MGTRRKAKDSATLLRMASALKDIIARGDKRGLHTTGLENARREFEYAARSFELSQGEKS